MAEHVFPFTESMLEAIVGHCLTDQSFFLKCHKKIKSQWFVKNILVGNIYDQLCRSYDTNGCYIKSPLEFKSWEFFLEQNDTELEKYYGLIDRCIYSAQQFNMVQLERVLTGFLRVSLFKESIEGAARRYKSDGFEDAFAWTEAKLKEIHESTFQEDGLTLSFENPDVWIKQHQLKRGEAISTGSASLDAALGGGLFKKETCAFMAPVNVGKTTAMITIARHAIRNKKKVLFIIHEGNPEEIRVRILSAFLAVKTSTIYSWMDPIDGNPKMKEIIRSVSNHINQYLTYMPYIKTGGMFVEDLVEEIKTRHDNEKLRTGHGYDLIIDDYPKKLKSRLRSGTKEGLYRVEASEIYDTFNHLATELDVHCFVAIQTNRNGLKMNNGKVDNDNLLGMEEIDESFGIAQNIANIITINRSAQDKANNILRLSIAKSRNAMTDIAINTKTAYNCALAFGDRNMFDTGGLWEMDIDKGFLPSYHQDSNAKLPTETIVADLARQVEIMPENKNVGVFIANSAQGDEL